MKVRTVLGLCVVWLVVDRGQKAEFITYASRSQAGVQPLMRNRGPSLRRDSAMILLTLFELPSAHVPPVVQSGVYPYWFNSVHGDGILNPAFQHICRRTSCGGNRSCQQRGEEMCGDSIFEP